MSSRQRRAEATASHTSGRANTHSEPPVGPRTARASSPSRRMGAPDRPPTVASTTPPGKRKQPNTNTQHAGRTRARPAGGGPQSSSTGAQTRARGTPLRSYAQAHRLPALPPEIARCQLVRHGDRWPRSTGHGRCLRWNSNSIGSGLLFASNASVATRAEFPTPQDDILRRHDKKSKHGRVLEPLRLQGVGGRPEPATDG